MDGAIDDIKFQGYSFEAFVLLILIIMLVFHQSIRVVFLKNWLLILFSF